MPPRVRVAPGRDRMGNARPCSSNLSALYFADTEPSLDPCASQDRITVSVKVRFRPDGIVAAETSTD